MKWPPHTSSISRRIIHSSMGTSASGWRLRSLFWASTILGWNPIQPSCWRWFSALLAARSESQRSRYSCAIGASRSLEQVAHAAAFRRRLAPQDHHPARLHRVDVLTSENQLRGPHAEVDPSAQPLRPRDLPVAVEVPPRRRHLALPRELHRPQPGEKKEQDRGADDDQRQDARLQ